MIYLYEIEKKRRDINGNKRVKLYFWKVLENGAPSFIGSVSTNETMNKDNLKFFLNSKVKLCYKRELESDAILYLLHTGDQVLP